MENILTPIITAIIDFLGHHGIFAGMFIIILESMIPILPLALFVAFNFSAYGLVEGFLVSYFGTILGCVIAYFLSSKLLGFYITKKSKEYEKFARVIDKIKKTKFSSLVLIIALPFSPAFLINISAGIVKMDLKKFIAALFIGKISIVYFWGIVGKSFIDSVGDVKTILIILLSLGFSYLLSKLVSKKMKLE